MCEAKNFYIWILPLVAFLGLLVLCLWLSLRPKASTYTITDFFVPNSSLPDNGSPNSFISYSLEIENPNQDSSVLYDDIVLTFNFGEGEVGKKTISSFHQGKGKKLQSKDKIEANPMVYKAILNKILNATLVLKVGLVTKVRYKTWGIKSKHHGVNMGAKLMIGSDGKVSGKKKTKLGHVSKKGTRLRSRPIRY